MMTSAMLRSATRSMARLTISSSTRPSLTKTSTKVVLSSSTNIHPENSINISYRSFISGATIEADAQDSSSTATAPKATRSTSTTKATKAKKPKTAGATKKKAPAKKKLRSWEKLGPDGKLLPLPSASKPKRRSAFLIYYSKRVPELKDDPSMQKEGGEGNKFDVVKATKKVGQEWSTLNEQEKEKFVQQAQVEGQQYERDLERWRNSLTQEDIRRENSYITFQKRTKGKKSATRLVDPSKPKQPLTAFFRFAQEFRQKNASELASLSIVERAKKAGAEWNNLASSEKEPFEAAYAKDKQRYEGEMQAYKQAQS